MAKKPINAFRKKRNHLIAKRKTPEQLNHRKIAVIAPDIRKPATGNRGNFHPRNTEFCLFAFQNQLLLMAKFQYKNNNSIYICVCQVFFEKYFQKRKNIVLTFFLVPILDNSLYFGNQLLLVRHIQDIF